MAPSPELDIRLHRAALNRTLAKQDLAVIGRLLAPNAVLVIGIDRTIISGRRRNF